MKPFINIEGRARLQLSGLHNDSDERLKVCKGLAKALQTKQTNEKLCHTITIWLIDHEKNDVAYRDRVAEKIWKLLPGIYVFK